VNSGLSVCVENTFSAPVTGTLDTGTGAATLNFQLNSRTVLTTDATTPCPTCRVAVGGALCAGTIGAPCVGVCDGSPNQGAACTSRNLGGVTSDCPSPSATAVQNKCYRGTNNGMNCAISTDCPGGFCAVFIGDIAISLNPLTTGTASLTGSFDNAMCTGAGAPVACCTGLGAGNCNVFCPGQTMTQKGAFRSDICTAGANSGKPCTSNANCPGSACRGGNLINYCVGGVNDGLGCAVASQCPSGTCLRAGTQAQRVQETGVPTGALAIGVPKAIKLGSAFCVGATLNPTVNSNANLPGPGATGITGNVTLLP